MESMMGSMAVTLGSSEFTEFVQSTGNNSIPIVIFIILGIVAVIGILFGTVFGISKKKEIEKTKRELAAYVAEGSMTPADAERILRSDLEES